MLKIYAPTLSGRVNSILFTADKIGAEDERVELNMMEGEYKSPEHLYGEAMMQSAGE